ncbi:unnamed protein product [Cochlearia groenlandica]
MAGRISCCLNLPFININSSKSSSSPLLNKTSQISYWTRTEDKTESQQKNKSSLPLAMAAAFVIGAIQISHVASVEAAVMKSPANEATAPPRRWSDKRACPPWLQNSLETIVPENLPRPSSHRRLELAGLGKRHAPPIGAVVTRGNRCGCFSV